ncbi:M23 family metallopeptidase [bacterium]|nr:M23 family metallopeptidase [bacterium]
MAKRKHLKRKPSRADHFSLVICRDGVLGTFHSELDRRGIRRFILITSLALVVALVLCFFYSDNLRKRLELFTLEITDSDQREELALAQSDIGELNQQLLGIREYNDVARLFHALPLVPESERGGGIGGVELGLTIASFPKIPNSPMDSGVQRYLERSLRLAGSINYESSLINQTIERTRRETDIRAHTPSIKPIVGHIVSFLGNRIHPITGLIHFHRGIDILAPRGTPIFAPADGVVTYAGTRGGYGITCFVNHGYGYQTRYGHCSKLHVKVGDEVKRGQIIAEVGSTGMSTGSHLHYEVLVDGSVTDPMAYIFPDYEFD